MLDLKNLPTNKTDAPTVNTSSILSGLNNAQTYEQGQYFNEPGTYNAVIERCVMRRSNKTGAPQYIMEFTIKDVLVPSPPITISADGGPVQVPNPDAPKVGSRRTFIQMLTDVNVAFPTLKAFALAALAPKTPADLEKAKASCEAVLEKAASDEQILKGTVINITVVAKTTRKGFLIHIPVFRPVAE